MTMYFIRLRRYILSFFRKSSNTETSQPNPDFYNTYSPIHLSRYRGEGSPPRLQWKETHKSTIKIFKAELTCHHGHGITLKNHKIDSNGKVTPSVVCLHCDCDFHKFVYLDEWSAGKIEASTF